MNTFFCTFRINDEERVKCERKKNRNTHNANTVALKYEWQTSYFECAHTLCTHLNQMSWEKEEKKMCSADQKPKNNSKGNEVERLQTFGSVSKQLTFFFMKLKRKAITNNNNNFEYTTQTQKHIHYMATAPNPWENISAQNQQQQHHHTLECFSLLRFLLYLKRQQQH